MNYQILAGYHDAVLSAINADKAASASVLTFELRDGSTRRVVLKGCELLRIVDFTNQNIVSRLIKYSGASADATDIADKLTWATSLSDASSYLSQEALTSIISRVQAGDASVLYLEPSNGAELVALFTEMVQDVAG